MNFYLESLIILFKEKDNIQFKQVDFDFIKTDKVINDIKIYSQSENLTFGNIISFMDKLDTTMSCYKIYGNDVHLQINPIKKLFNKNTCGIIIYRSAILYGQIYGKQIKLLLQLSATSNLSI